MRDLHNEKRNGMKKNHEIEELKKTLKSNEHKCDSLELKLDERETMITRFKTKIAQMDSDMVKIANEYEKLRHANKNTQT
jgi:peptidoglycan hydrolase CwlO-like protein